MLEELRRVAGSRGCTASAAIESSRGRSDKAWKDSRESSSAVASPKIYTQRTGSARKRQRESSRFSVCFELDEVHAPRSSRNDSKHGHLHTYTARFPPNSPLPRETTSSRHSSGNRTPGPSAFKGSEFYGEPWRDLSSWDAFELTNFERLCRYEYISRSDVMTSLKYIANYLIPRNFVT